jgi:hypothetical protein
MGHLLRTRQLDRGMGTDTESCGPASVLWPSNSVPGVYVSSHQMHMKMPVCGSFVGKTANLDTVWGRVSSPTIMMS